MRKLIPVVAGFMLAAVVGVAMYPRPREAGAQQGGHAGPDLVRYGDVIVDLNRVIAISHTKGDAIRFTLDAARPDGTAVEIILSKNMSEEPDYVEQNWLKLVKDLRVGH